MKFTSRTTVGANLFGFMTILIYGDISVSKYQWTAHVSLFQISAIASTELITAFVLYFIQSICTKNPFRMEIAAN